MEHGLAGIMLSDQPGRPIIVCRCGCVASGVTGQLWNITRHEDGSASCAPSLNWAGHFHVIAERTAVLSDLPDNFRVCDEEVTT